MHKPFAIVTLHNTETAPPSVRGAGPMLHVQSPTRQPPVLHKDLRAMIEKIERDYKKIKVESSKPQPRYLEQIQSQMNPAKKSS